MIDRKDNKVLETLAASLISRENFKEFYETFIKILNVVDPNTRVEISNRLVYGTQLNQERLELAFRLLNSGDQVIIQGIGTSAFKNDKITDRRFWQRFIEVADQKPLSMMATASFRDGDVEFKREFMRAVIQKGDNRVLQSLLMYSFEYSKSLNWRDELILIARKASLETAQIMVKSLFSMPNSVVHEQALDILTKAHGTQLWNTKRIWVFSKDHAIAFKNQIRYIIQNSDETLLRGMAEVFANDGFLGNQKMRSLMTSDPKWIAIKKAISISDRKQRSRVLFEQHSIKSCQQAVTN